MQLRTDLEDREWNAVGSPYSFLQETRSWISRGSQLCGSISLKNSGSIESVNLASPFPMAWSPLSKYDVDLGTFVYVTEPSSQCRTTSIMDYSSTHSKGEWVQKHKPWTGGCSHLRHMVNIHILQNVPWLSTYIKHCFSCSVLREAHLELFICFYGDSPFEFSHFSSPSGLKYFGQFLINTMQMLIFWMIYYCNWCYYQLE